MKRPLRTIRHRPTHAASPWQRTLVVVWIVEFIALIGFSMVLPFLPFYVQELGVTGEADIKVWSGIILGSYAVTMALFAPIWGTLADRYGRKLMLERAMFGSAAVMILMAFVQTPTQLLILRLLQGVLTGTVAAATTLIASIVPRERTGYALGWLQMGVYAGVSIGPLVGGIIADTWGFRTPFLITGACLLLGGLGIIFFVHEGFRRPQSQSSTQPPQWWAGLATVIRSRELLIVFGARLLSSMGSRIIGPVLPLFVATLLPSSARLATVTGIVTGAGAAASSIGAAILGRVGDRIGFRTVVTGSALVAALFYAAQAAVSNTTQLVILQFGAGLAMAGIVSALAALLATLAPAGQQGAVYGLDTSVVSSASALGPMLGASLAVAFGNRATFLLSAMVFALAAGAIGWLLPRAHTEADTSERPTSQEQRLSPSRTKAKWTHPSRKKPKRT